jgi:hypothetical protein
MKYLLKLEEAAMFALSVYLLSLLPVDFPWWLWVLLFFSPDIGMLGYLFNPATGAITYNLFHHKGIAVALWLYGLYSGDVNFQLLGLIFFGHSSFDRILGYGLKYSDDFKNTHLGRIGNG